ncbi:MAG TPA: hypothetical protein VFT59_05275, partial [Candidatus Saccharimonadales bacterium]|nr:hypothetical protein [Candidatus Saccharimonadales bacterium]
MSEKENRALRYDNNRMYEESRELLGKNRLEPLSVFSTEEHLQRTFDALRSDPNKLPVTYSSIGGGTTLIDE